MRSAGTATPRRCAARRAHGAAVGTGLDTGAVSARPSAVGGAASLALRRVLLGLPRSAEVLAVFQRAAYLAAGEEVVALVAEGAVATPNAVRGAERTPIAALAAGAPVRIGDGELRCGDVAVRVGRWWDPRPRVPTVRPDELGTRAARLPAVPPGLDRAARGTVDVLALAAHRGAGEEAAAAAVSLVGRGAGLTPAGDDVLAGVLAAWAVLGSAAKAPPWLDGVADAVAVAALADAPARTTRVSAALLDHARRGETSEAAATVLRALAGRGDLATAAHRLAGVGATSGRDLLAGVRLAAVGIAEVAATHDVMDSGDEEGA